MNAMRFVLRGPPSQRLDMSALTPDRLAGMEMAAIERLTLHTTREAACVADVFAVRAGDPASVVIEGGSARLDRVGETMRSGTLRIEGAVGAYAGRKLAGGRLQITGDAGPFAASGMIDGQIEIGGDAGARLGGPTAGERAGMRGGVVIVRGGAGERAGERLRRGLIVVGGDAGRYAGCAMIAGTLVICGEAAEGAGVLMRRGTIVLGRTPPLLPTFVALGGGELVFRRLLARALEPLHAEAAALAAAATRRFGGDMATIGKGEIVMPA